MRRPVCLVFGAAGFIGSHLARRLLAEGAEVHAVVREGSSLERLRTLGDALRLHRFDMRDTAALERCIAKTAPEEVYHLAAETRDAATEDPVAIGQSLTDYLEPLMHLLAFLANTSRPPRVLVRAGSIAEYGDAALPYREDRREHPVTPYGARMLAATHQCMLLEKSLPFPVHTARLALTYGEGQSESFLLPALIKACEEGRRFTIRRPDDRRDLIHVDDVVEAMLRLGKATDAGSLMVNIATGTAPTMREVAERVAELTGCSKSLLTYGQSTEDESSILLASTEHAQEKIGWSARIDLERGLQITLGIAQHDHEEKRLRHA
ncbi:NAD-dependent epimerase/dehydratase family protein [Aurantiacibacter poecillastricola]|uniref:NAD-dependent epimerase/dehydratase family protein n=1 Tax=Aurantiacibacter poecillastricola TaxID=3064385 RepID=UPI00273F63B1|nr:NAD-dependent epimerase/dehydratase family protein [Aurantiacibacter sp. 219JJ12-13]MDP5262419.1 GDP-mannose 4,6-dehydratase [Aurantiacibacter sp. 219JJ12-13]